MPMSRTYKVLNELISKELVTISSTIPAQYALANIEKSCQKWVQKRIKQLEKLPETARQLTLVESQEVDSMQYLVQIKGKEVKLINKLNNTVVKDVYELK